jgi:hypothetical protein
MSGIVTLDMRTWSGPFDPDLCRLANAELEAGRVLFLPELNFALSASELESMRAAVEEARDGDGGKSVSYDPVTGKRKAGPLSEVLADRLAEPVARFAQAAHDLIVGLFPGYAPGLEPGRASFRPMEIEGRSLSWRKDDRRLHVDAFPSRPVGGKRILRVFSNVDPDSQPRRWRVGEPFEAHAQRFLPRLPKPSRSQAWMLSRLGLTRGVQTSYDQLMLGLHDAAKRDATYQAADAQLQDFPAGSSWIVYTDQTPHAALAGRCAFEQTFYVRPEVLTDPDSAPLAVLERLTGRRLVTHA